MSRYRPQFQFETDCIHSTGPKIIAMTDAAREVTWATFKQHVPVEQVQAVFPFYSYRGEKVNAAGNMTCPLHIKDDYAVGFWKSTYEGRPCYYITHSAIEYIWTEV